MSEEEILLVVDEDDDPVDEAPRSVVHERALPHRAVHVLLADEAGRVWLQKRSQRKRTHPGRWTSSASGHVPAGDTLHQAALRETEEELGVRPEALAYLGWVYVEELDLGEREFSHVFAGAWSDALDPDGDEVAEVEAREPADLDALVETEPERFAASFRQVWRAAREGELRGQTQRLSL